MSRSFSSEVFPPVEVFRTNVEYEFHAVLLVDVLAERFPGMKANFALDDCDRVLRVQGENIDPVQIIKAIEASGFSATLLT